MADIHFAPSVALRVAECFDKIRVNPGNFGMNMAVVLSFLFSIAICIQRCFLLQLIGELSLRS